MELVIERTMQRMHRRKTECEENQSVLLLRRPAEESVDTTLRLVHPEDDASPNGTEQAHGESEKVPEENSM